jgi:hypothetical protein
MTKRRLGLTTSRIAASPDLILANAVCCPEIAGGGADAIRSNERREFITLLGGVAAGGACYVEK